MSKIPFTEAVAKHKENENQGVALMVHDRRVLSQMLACWPMVKIEQPSDSVEEEAAKDWLLLWKAVKIKPSDLAKLMGVSTAVAKNLIEQGKSLRLIYPDSTIHKVGQVLVQRRLKAALEKV